MSRPAGLMCNRMVGWLVPARARLNATPERQAAAVVLATCFVTPVFTAATATAQHAGLILGRKGGALTHETAIYCPCFARPPIHLPATIGTSAERSAAMNRMFAMQPAGFCKPAIAGQPCVLHRLNKKKGRGSSATGNAICVADVADVACLVFGALSL